MEEPSFKLELEAPTIQSDYSVIAEDTSECSGRDDQNPNMHENYYANPNQRSSPAVKNHGKDCYSIVEISEEGRSLLSVLPSRWVIRGGWRLGDKSTNDLCYWPKGAFGLRLLEDAKLDPTVGVDLNCLQPKQCTIKTTGMSTFEEAVQERISLEANSQEVSSHQASLKPIQQQLDRMQREINVVKRQMSTCISLLTTLSEKMDRLAQSNDPSARVVLPMPDPEEEIPFKPITNEQEMEALELKAADESFVQTVIRTMGKDYRPSDYLTRGRTVCLRLLDRFFDRKFLCLCSWTGSGRKSQTDRELDNDKETIRKIPFNRYQKIHRMFYRVVFYADPTFSYDLCLKALHFSLRNSSKRATENKNLRLPVEKNRRKKFIKRPRLIEVDIDESNSQIETNGGFDPHEEIY
ncbi:uncharacterized protein LOC129743615 [Uranotaenia lowii]|uniref:uncharacterized protein LOC129743615 n=1 Tax=Uranotaenia lowii TaxID=190385 RepID=UPI00247914F7|nr:uncharacterized protein LOC129743615 [Uranotaenia lowii]